MLIGADRLFASPNADETERIAPSSPKAKGEGRGRFESLLYNTSAQQAEVSEEAQKTRPEEGTETVASLLSDLLSTASKGGRLKLPSFATPLEDGDGTMVASEVENVTEESLPDGEVDLKAEDITSSQIDDLLSSLLGPVARKVLDPAWTDVDIDNLNKNPLGDTGPIELQSEYPLGDTGPIELQSEYPLGDTGPIELQSEYPLGDTGPIELQSEFPLDDTGPIEPQSEYPLGDTGPVEPQAVKLPPESGLAVESTGIGTSPKDNILSPLPAGLSGISLDGLDVNGPDGVDAEMEIPVSSTVEPKPLSQQINEGGKTENGDPLSTMSLNGQKEEYPATEGFSAKRTDIQNVSEDVLSARENSYVASSPLVVEEAISRLKSSSPRTFESRGYSLKMESISLPEDSVEAETDATVVDKEPIRAQTSAKEAPVFLSSWSPDKREEKFEPVTEISENKPEDSAQRAVDHGFESLIGQGEARQSIQPRSEIVPAQTIYLPQKGPDALPHGLAQVVRQVMTDGTQKATVIIDPPALGRVEVEVRATSTGIEASFKVDSAQVRDMIKPQIPLLQDMLSQNGIVASSISVDIRQGDERRSPWRDSLDSIKLRRRKGAVDEEEVEITSMEIARIDMERGVLQWYA